MRSLLSDDKLHPHWRLFRTFVAAFSANRLAGLRSTDDLSSFVTSGK
jgi:hypothetical protein